ncbi:PaaX family transcriptional regulator [Streptomyces sp. NBC_01267]|uniref:PaaX family transcriptional regulator n=1 Tax=unclassified Streptomyces TaxID=2593676 RepID=UPI0020259D52|nr:MULTISPECIES: PaaX family transcriptional regulator C-terminal domain-containing protein [unclassified Streptomyces]MCX4553717.1 PaaX family transcriptional regulator [Streptomyces sp. NBC_01500]WSV52676.1 PaaX family transcriptional regulator [Streptomyces sp. NBC_01014]
MTRPHSPQESTDAAEGVAPARPQSLMMSFFGIHVLGRDIALSSACVIDAFARVRVGEDAVRSTLTRMVGRGLLERHRRGRRMYFSLTERAATVLSDGQERIWRDGAVNREWDGTWTLVGFSLPESRRRERHDLRSRLVWAGFGPVQSGLWVAPRRVDVAPLAAELGLAGHIRAFHGEAAPPTEAGSLLHAAFDVDAIAAGYRSFVERWDGPVPPGGAADDMARQLLLHTDWLELVRDAPYLPAEHLPEGWPAARAEELFRELARRYEPGASRLADEMLERIDLVGESAAGEAGTEEAATGGSGSD